MSRNQKPGKVRVIGERDAGASSDHPLRRATDFDPEVPRGTADDRGGPIGGQGVAARAGTPLLSILVFLIAAAAGGALFTLYVLPGLAK